MTADPIPLLARDPAETVAIRAGRPVSGTSLLAEAGGFATALPATGAVINLCNDRYRFLVGFVAALARGLPTLLPPDSRPATVNAIHARWPGSVVLADGPCPGVAAPIVDGGRAARGVADNPRLAPEALAVVAFTSGSTGAPVALEKRWRTLVEGTAMNLRYYLPTGLPPGLPAGAGPWSIVSTVPPQHMYGLETSVLCALRGPAAMHDGRPFYPADVADALAAAPAPRVLVTTPVHLRAIADAGIAFPPVARILSATAPLEAALATQAESLLAGELVEIYGCSEVGSMAWRRTSAGSHWQLFDRLRARVDGGATEITAAHLPAAVRLPDQLEFGVDGSFLLGGRDSDLVKIAGKRGSLAGITRLLLAIPGVDDAVVFPAPAEAGRERLAALVVSATLDAPAVLAALRPYVDPVFLPRPVLVVGALPRSGTGKLPRAEVLRLYAEARGTSGD